MDGGAGPGWHAVLAALLVGAGACGGDLADPACGGGDGLSPFAPADGPFCERLSTYGMLSLDGDGRAVPADGVLPFRPATELFSDYAVKTRTLHVPPGAWVELDAHGELRFPVGTVLTKTFSFPRDLREPHRDLRVIETRVLIRQAHGWEAAPYLWNDAQTEAFHRPVGDAVPVSFVHHDGEPRSTIYPVPNRSQCIECHGQGSDAEARRSLHPIGARTRHVNVDLDYGAHRPGEPVQNQLERWAQEGWLAGLPVGEAAPSPLPAWDDPGDGTLHGRARAYLDVNCGHCHNPRGSAGTSTALRLHWDEQDPSAYGVCFANAIRPGDPDRSRVVSRMSATEGTRVMPRIGRTLVHGEGVGLIREWVEWLGTPEAAEALGLDPALHRCP
jgi:uncharacterized repeat protein (TIGR03806 family)